MQSDTNPSPTPNSLLAGKMQGILQLSPDFGAQDDLKPLMLLDFLTKFPARCCRELNSRIRSMAGNSMGPVGISGVCTLTASAICFLHGI